MKNTAINRAIKTVLFDLDDTLCDDASCWIECSMQSARLAAAYLPEIDTKRLANEFLRQSREYWFSEQSTRETRSVFEVRTSQWLGALEKSGCERLMPLAQEMARDYGARRVSEISLFPEAVDTIVGLRSRGITVAIVSNGFESTHVPKIANLGLKPHLDHVILADVIGHFKPDARIFYHALDLCGCSPDEAIMVGDDLSNDIGGAEAAGIRSCWFNPSGYPRELGDPKPSLGEISKLSEVLTLLT